MLSDIVFWGMYWQSIMSNIYGTGASSIRKSCKFGFLGLILNVFQIFLYVSVVKKSLTALSAWAIPWKVPFFFRKLGTWKVNRFYFQVFIVIVILLFPSLFLFRMQIKKIEDMYFWDSVFCFCFPNFFRYHELRIFTKTDWNHFLPPHLLV